MLLLLDLLTLAAFKPTTIADHKTELGQSQSSNLPAFHSSTRISSHRGALPLCGHLLGRLQPEQLFGRHLEGDL